MNIDCLLVIFLTSTFLCNLVSCQMDSSCPYPSDSDIAQNIGNSLDVGDTGDIVNITLIQWRPVCLAYSQTINRYRGISLVAEYNCTGASTCPSTQPAVEQFEFACSSGSEWNLGIINGHRTVPSDANFSTPLFQNCSFCYSPVTAASLGAPTDDINHCVPCATECSGLMRCFGQLASQCCNVYSSSTCAKDCLTKYVPDSNGVCVCPPGRTGANCEALHLPIILNATELETTGNGMCSDMKNEDILNMITERVRDLILKNDFIDRFSK